MHNKVLVEAASAKGGHEGRKLRSRRKERYEEADLEVALAAASSQGHDEIAQLLVEARKKTKQYKINQVFG
ncbi:hypothetical protein MY8738_005694 [Beauveria namnaoensis]